MNKCGECVRSDVGFFDKYNPMCRECSNGPVRGDNFVPRPPEKTWCCNTMEYSFPHVFAPNIKDRPDGETLRVHLKHPNGYVLAIRYCPYCSRPLKGYTFWKKQAMTQYRVVYNWYTRFHEPQMTSHMRKFVKDMERETEFAKWFNSEFKRIYIEIEKEFGNK